MIKKTRLVAMLAAFAVGSAVLVETASAAIENSSTLKLRATETASSKNSFALEDAQLDGKVVIFATAPKKVKSVAFFVDNKNMKKPYGSPVTEAPFYLAAANKAGEAEFDTSTLKPGKHEIGVKAMDKKGNVVETARATFKVVGTETAPPSTTTTTTVTSTTQAPTTTTTAAPTTTTSTTAAPPAPSGCALPAFPDETCTGVPAGTVLEQVNGHMTINTANTIIDGKEINGCVLVKAPGVVIRNSKIHCPHGTGVASYAPQYNGYSGQGVLIHDSEIDCKNQPGTAIGDTNFTAIRVNVHGCENGFDVDTDVVIRDSYIHDLYNSAEAHADGIQFAIGKNVVIEHNTIYANSGTSSIITHPTTTADVVIKDNLLAGGAWTLYCPRDYSTNVKVIGNRFSTKFYPKIGAFGPWTGCSKVAEATGNVYHETNAPLAPN